MIKPPEACANRAATGKACSAREEPSSETRICLNIASHLSVWLMMVFCGEREMLLQTFFHHLSLVLSICFYNHNYITYICFFLSSESQDMLAWAQNPGLQ